MLGRPAAPFRFWDPRRPIYTHLRHLPASRLTDCRLTDSVIAEGCFLDRCDVSSSVVGVRALVLSGSRITNSVLLGADTYDEVGANGQPVMGIGRDCVLDRVIVDKNARIGDGSRLVNEKGIEQADGDGYYIRGGIIVVPKFGTIAPGTVV